MRKNGQGTQINENSSTYVRGFKERKENGQGKYNNPNGIKYVWEHKDDPPNGQGIVSYPNGKKCEGEWVNGRFQNGKYYNKGETIQYNLFEWRRDKTIKLPKTKKTMTHLILIIFSIFLLPTSVFSFDWTVSYHRNKLNGIKSVTLSVPKVIKGLWKIPNLKGNWTCWLGRNDYETHSNVGLQCRSKENKLIVLYSEIQCNKKNRQKNKLGVVYPRSIKNDENIGKTVIFIVCEL